MVECYTSGDGMGAELALMSYPTIFSHSFDLGLCSNVG
jgi:hypothetical protein